MLFSAVRVISGEQALTSSQTFSAALLLAVPIGLAALGGLFSERAGVVNIGLEGMMILGTWGAGWAGYQWGWAGAVVGGVAFGLLGGLLHAIATVTFGVDHVVSGVAINILAAGSSGSSPSCSTSTTRPVVAPPSRRPCPASHRSSRCRCSPRGRTCWATSRRSTGSWSATSPACCAGSPAGWACSPWSPS